MHSYNAIAERSTALSGSTFARAKDAFIDITTSLYACFLLLRRFSTARSVSHHGYSFFQKEAARTPPGRIHSTCDLLPTFSAIAAY